MKKVNMIISYTMLIISMISLHAVISKVFNIFSSNPKYYREWFLLIMGLSVIALFLSYFFGLITKEDLKYKNDVLFFKYVGFWMFVVQLTLSIASRFFFKQFNEVGIPFYISYIVLLSPTFTYIVGKIINRYLPKKM